MNEWSYYINSFSWKIPLYNSLTKLNLPLINILYTFLTWLLWAINFALFRDTTTISHTYITYLLYKFHTAIEVNSNAKLLQKALKCIAKFT